MIANPRVSEAATWHVIADLMRRHEARHHLHVIESHPGGGQFDCRTIVQFSPDGSSPVLGFDLGSGKVHIHRPLGKPRKPERQRWGHQEGPLPYVEAVLPADHPRDVVCHLEALLGLPSPSTSPSTTRHGLAYRVMAEVAARAILSGPEVRWENGRNDTSDCPPEDPVRPELPEIQQIASELISAEGRQPGDLPGQAYWLWRSRPKPGAPWETVAVIDTDAMLYRPGPPEEAVDMATEYAQLGRDLAALVSLRCFRVEERLPKGPAEITRRAERPTRPPLTIWEVLRVLRQEVRGPSFSQKSLLSDYMLDTQMSSFARMHFGGEVWRHLHDVKGLNTLDDAIEYLKGKVAP